MKRRFFLELSGVSLLLCAAPIRAIALDEQAAVADAAAAASAWLALLDAGKYAECWEAASARMRSVLTKDQLVHAFGAVLEPLGKLTTRKQKDAKFKQSLPGAPDGSYVVIQYDSAFENKKNAIETVIPMLEPDGKWRVSGYFIK